ncbi:TolC family protein [Pelodictyon luteolum]|uniref:LipD protein, putative n=1 Tax=Chlorobium luteolum (strain DSM 273 / BCRC 81028 / 2530) TaxID=319225 RepID=Q3B1D8_CHLL3|nr:TolC family protein [Pelodictyon luteolum]ABB24843.1 LipD protein, putative [Pelodictyon luteolum DSM 273]
MKVSKALAAFLVAASLSTPSGAEAAAKTLKLSLKEAISMARENNSTIKAARSRVDQAEGRIVQSRKSYLPTVTLSENFVRTNDPLNVFGIKLMQTNVVAGDLFNMNTMAVSDKLNEADPISDFNTSLQLMQPIFNRDGAIGRGMARKAKVAEQYMTARTEETIELYVSKAYYGMMLALRNITAIDQSIATMQRHSSEAGRAFNAGMLPKSDKLSTDVRLAELREQKLMLQDGVKEAKDALRVLLNLEADVNIEPTGTFAVDAALPSLKASSTRSDLMAMETYRQLAEEQGEMASAARLPRLNAFARTDHHTADFDKDGSSWMVGLNMQWQIFDGMAVSGKVQEAKAREREARYSYEAAKSNSAAEVAKALRSMKTAKERIAVAGQSLDGAKVSLDYIGEQYRTGKAMTFELLMREGAYTYAKMRLNQAKYDYAVAKSELAYYGAK